MACYKPLKGYRAPFPNANGKFGFVFDKSGAAVIPCGQCIGCRLDRSRKWAIRCLHEASLYEENCFITLTYDASHLPLFGALVKSDFQRFLKRLRKRYGRGIRFYACGEYGDQGQRPHFHACLFNHDFADKQIWSVRNEVKLYTSESLARLWPFGFSSVGDVTFESAAYVARYVMKKITGPKSELHYTRLVPETGELVSVPSEFTLMSLKPGIGKPWLDRYMTDVYPHDYVVVRGVKMKPPRYYDLQFEKLHEFLFADIKEERVNRSRESVDNTRERLKVREKVARAGLTRLKRSL